VAHVVSYDFTAMKTTSNPGSRDSCATSPICRVRTRACTEPAPFIPVTVNPLSRMASTCSGQASTKVMSTPAFAMCAPT